MNRAIGWALVLAGCAGGGPAEPASEACAVDSACKGDRICESGVCVDPDALDPDPNGPTSLSSSSTPVDVTGAKVHPCGAPPDDPPPDPVAGPDTRPPAVTCVGFDQTAYAAGDSGYVEFVATDAGSGITDFQGNCGAFVSRSGMSDGYVCGVVEPLGGDLYRLGFDVGLFVEQGRFALESFGITDRAGNATWLDASFGDDWYDGTDVAVAYTEVASSDVDVTAPVVTAIGFAQPVNHAGDDTAYVVYQATDDGAGIATFESGCWSIVSRTGNTALYACGVVERDGGSYRLPFDVPPSAEYGDYALTYATVHDEAGNGFPLSADPRDAVYDGTSIAVAHVTIQP